MTNDSSRWILPEPTAVFPVSVQGAELVVRRHGNPDGPRIAISHGNGLAVDMYYPFWSLLEKHFDIFAYDLRNHGWNKVTSIRLHNLPVMVEDNAQVLEEIAKRFGDRSCIGVFHSVSTVLASMTITPSERYRALFLVDPPLYWPGVRPEKVDAALTAAAAFARNRTNSFRGHDEFVELMSYSPWFRHMSAPTKQLVARTTLKRREDGTGYELRCPPEYEAMIWEFGYAMSGLSDLLNLKCPVKVLGADPTLPVSFLPTIDIDALVHIQYDFIPDVNHFLQLDYPLECVEVLLEFLTSEDIIEQDLADSCLAFAREQVGLAPAPAAP